MNDPRWIDLLHELRFLAPFMPYVLGFMLLITLNGWLHGKSKEREMRRYFLERGEAEVRVEIFKRDTKIKGLQDKVTVLKEQNTKLRVRVKAAVRLAQDIEKLK